MKKEFALVLIVVAFVAGIVVGVITAVLYEEKSHPALTAMQQPSPAAVPPAISPVDIQKQIAPLLSILKDDPQNLKALIELGNAYFDSGQVDKSIEAYSKALEINPKNADVRTDLGIMYRRKRNFDRAIEEFKKAAEDDPKHVNSRYNLGIVYLHDKGDLKAAIKAWEDYLKVEPTGPRADNIRNQMGKMKAMAK